MVIRLLECKHCGTEYRFQASGHNPNQYEENQDDKYCHDCKTAIINTLAAIPKKFEYRFVPTTEVTLEQLEKWEVMNDIEAQLRGGFATARRIFASLYHNGEHQIIRQVIGKGNEHEGKVFIYRYWPSDKEKYTITVEQQFNIATGESVKYRYRRL